MSSVRYLHECDLKTLGFNKMGPRKVILQAIYQLRGAPRPSPPALAPLADCPFTS